MNDTDKIQELEKRIDAMNTELEKSNILANKNLPILVKTVFLFLFFLIMAILKPELVIKIVEIFIKSFGAVVTQ
jgi:hypothetical protein